MSHVNVGARTVRGDNVKTKKQLRELLNTDPGSVVFYQTSMFAEGPGEFSGAQIPAGVILSVCGPDPATSRKWYASVASGARGALQVS